MKNLKRLFFLLTLLATTSFCQQGQLPILEKLPSSTCIVDESRMLTSGFDQALQAKLWLLRQLTGIRMVAVQIPELPPNPDPRHDTHHPAMDPKDAADTLGKRWNLGEDGDPNSVVIVFAGIPRRPKSFTTIGISRGKNTVSYWDNDWVTKFLLYTAWPVFNQGLNNPPPNPYWYAGIKATATGMMWQAAKHTTRPKAFIIVAMALIWLIAKRLFGKKSRPL